MIAGASIYRWRSTALRQYGQGHAIAIGRTADEARIRIRIHARAWIKSDSGKAYLDEREDDDREQLDAFHAQLDRDLAAEPEVTDAMLIWGSE